MLEHLNLHRILLMKTSQLICLLLSLVISSTSFAAIDAPGTAPAANEEISDNFDILNPTKLRPDLHDARSVQSAERRHELRMEELKNIRHFLYTQLQHVEEELAGLGEPSICHRKKGNTQEARSVKK